MNRILGTFAFSSVLLTACGGGGIQSPDFQPVLTGIVITTAAENGKPETTTTGSGSSAVITVNPVTVLPAGTIQLRAQGLFSTPPGTRAATGLVSCTDAGGSAALCSVGDVSGVALTIDPPSGGRTLATVDANGVVTGVRRGTATVRGRLGGFTDTTRTLTVDGPVLKSVTITARDVKNNVDLNGSVKSVPAGRSMQLTGIASCDSRAGDTAPSPSKCTNTNYAFNWSLPLAAPADTVMFTPNPAVGRIIAIKTQRFGPFSIDLKFNNEEGDPIETSINLQATSRVLDDIVVVADTTQSEPISIIKGTRVKFTAKGVFSDGTTDDLIEADLGTDRPAGTTSTYRAGRRLTWRQDSSFIGGPISIEDPADADKDGMVEAGETGIFNNSVIVTVVETANSPAVIGPNGLNAAGFNIEQIPVAGTAESDPLLVEDRAAINIEDLGLTAVTRICLDSDLASQCTTNTQVQEGGDPVKYVARGTFLGDPEGSERNIDPRLIPIQFTPSVATANLIDVNVDADRDGTSGSGGDFDDVGTVRGKAQGLARLIATLPSGFATTIADRDAETNIAVTERSCLDQFLISNGTTATADNGDLIGISDVRDPGNVIDGVPATYGTFTVGPSVLGGSLSMDFQRVGTSTLLGGATQNVGFTLNDRNGYVSASTVTIRTLNAEGGTVETFTDVSPSSNGAEDDAQRTLIFARATQPYTGVRLTLDVPLLLGVPGTVFDLPEFTLLLGNEIRVYSACANVVQP